MKKRVLITLCLGLLYTANLQAQIYLTRNAKVSFFSKTSMENIEAVNNEVSSILDTKKGEFAFVVLIKSFKFQKALMEEHFNENYLESNTFPKSNFRGAVKDMSKINFSADGSYPVTVTGDLTIHGVTQHIEAPGTISIAQGIISADSKFPVKLKDYNIKVPSTVINKIAESIDVTVECKFDPVKKS